jgi:tetratricopeptide (TPR) repeat protein
MEFPAYPQKRHSAETLEPQYHLAAIVLLSLVSVVSYLPVSGSELLAWDTQIYINENLAIHEIDSASLWWMLTQSYHANWHPLTWLSHALDIQLFGFAPFGHHWVNVAWHIACAWILFLYSQQLLPRILPSKVGHDRFAIYRASLFAALLFAVHPQHTESVAWVAERKDLLCGFFYLLCLYSYHAYLHRPGPTRYLGTLVCAAAAIMSKPMAVSLPVVLVLLDLFVYQRLQFCFWRVANWRLPIAEKIPFVLLAALSVYLTLESQASSGAVSSLESVSIAQRLAISVINWSDYLVTTIVPAGLSPYYPFPDSLSWLQIFISLAVLIGLLLAAEFYRRRGRNWVMLAVLYYGVTILPVIGLVQIGTIRAADRYTYLPTLPLYLVIAVLLIRALDLERIDRLTIKRKSARISVLLLIPLVLGFSTYQYSKVWQNDTVLWEFVSHKEADDIHVAIFMAEAYYQNQRYADALPLYQRAFVNRSLIPPEQQLNKFVIRYFDTAFRLEHYQEAEIALFDGMREQRLWFMAPEDIYYDAALVNLKMSRYDTALELAEMAARYAKEPEKYQQLKARIARLKENNS